MLDENAASLIFKITDFDTSKEKRPELMKKDVSNVFFIRPFQSHYPQELFGFDARCGVQLLWLGTGFGAELREGQEYKGISRYPKRDTQALTQ